MMILADDQKRKVEENIGLVSKVIRDKVHGPYQMGIYSREDLLQIGCIGLCKAAATDKGGCFSTYAYRLIWNEICDALVYSSRLWDRETMVEEVPEGNVITASKEMELKLDMESMLREVKRGVPNSTRKGIQALILMTQGYSSKEIGKDMGASANLVCAWVSKARKHLRARPEFEQMARG